MSFVVKEDLSIEYAEERRLFYVAMTRTKNRVFFIAPQQNPSEFLLEIKRDYKNVELKGEWNEDPEKTPYTRKTCPMCGYPMQFRYKAAYGLRLYICTNEPEVCGFMTNEYKAGKLSIIKCDQCRDGYLIVKPGKEKTSYMLGCTNYKKDGTGCSRIMSPKYFYNYMNINDLEPGNPVVIPRGLDIKPKSKVDEKEKPVAQKIEERTIIEAAEVKTVFYQGNDLNQVIVTILQCLNDISFRKYYGITVLVDVLRGSQSKKLLDGGLNLVNGYGELTRISREDLSFIVEWLISNGFILQTKGQYPVLHPTNKGINYNTEMTTRLLNTLKRELEKPSP